MGGGLRFPSPNSKLVGPNEHCHSAGHTFFCVETSGCAEIVRLGPNQITPEYLDNLFTGSLDSRSNTFRSSPKSIVDQQENVLLHPLGRTGHILSCERLANSDGQYPSPFCV